MKTRAVRLHGVMDLRLEEIELPDEVKALLEERKAARKERNFALADQLRDKISSLGYSVEETRQGTVVKKL